MHFTELEKNIKKEDKILSVFYSPSLFSLQRNLDNMSVTIPYALSVCLTKHFCSIQHPRERKEGKKKGVEDGWRNEGRKEGLSSLLNGHRKEGGKVERKEGRKEWS